MNKKSTEIGCEHCGGDCSAANPSVIGCPEPAFSELLESVQQMDAMLKAQPEQPEVVGYRSATSRMVYEKDYGLQKPEPLMTVAQHERIVGALRESSAFWGRASARMQKERDAALARVEELEKQEPDLSAMARILSDRTAMVCNVDADDHWQLYGDEIIADVKAMMEAHPYYTTPVAQAQHSVPIAHEFKRALGLVVAALEADGDRPTSKYALSELKKVLAAAPGKDDSHE